MKQQSHDQLPTFEKTLAAENARLTAMKDELARLTQGRGDAIRAALDKMPNHVRRDDGLLGADHGARIDRAGRFQNRGRYRAD